MNHSPPSVPDQLASSRWALAGGAAVAVLLVALGAWMRAQAALNDLAFDAVHPEGMLKSDPALLYYFVERILESGGGVPPDFRADPRILHPRTVDVPALFPLGLEFVVAWARLLVGSTEPLHLFCLHVTSVLASTVVLGVYGLALELTRRVGWALLAAGLFTFTWANYRTVGFLLVGEDFSMPWFALHLYLLARAWRLRTGGAVALAAATWVAALATWHATSFFASIEAALVWAWFARTGANPLQARRALLFPALACASTLVVPILWSTRAWGALPMQVLVGLGCAAALARRGVRSHLALVAGSVCGAGAWLAVAYAVSRAFGGGLTEYSHVFGLLAEKVRHLGVLPADPAELPAEVRLMWQGPFATAPIGEVVAQLGLGLVVLLFVLPGAGRQWLRGTGDPRPALAAAGLVTGLVLALLVARTIILPGMLLPVLAGWTASELAARARTPAWKQGVLVAAIGLLGVQVADTADHVRGFASSWYQPVQRQQEIRALVGALPGLVPEGEAVASDFMNSTAILAHTRHPILLQPKYEDRESRERAVEFYDAIFQGTPADLRRLLLERYRCRYLVLDRYTLVRLGASRYLGGARAGEPPRRGTWWELLEPESGPVLPEVPGYRLLYRSPPSIRWESGDAADNMRLYELRP